MDDDIDDDNFTTFVATPAPHVHSLLPMGNVLRLGYVNPVFPLLYEVGPLRVKHGLYVDIWKLFAKRHGYRIEYVRADNYGGHFPVANGSWEGLLGMLYAGEIDATLEHQSVRAARVRDFAPTRPVLYTKDQYVLRQSIQEVQSFYNLTVFSPSTVGLLISIFMIIHVFERLAVSFIRRRTEFSMREGLQQTISTVTVCLYESKQMSFVILRRMPASAYLISITLVMIIYSSAFKGNLVFDTYEQVFLNTLIDKLSNGETMLLLPYQKFLSKEKMLSLYGRVLDPEDTTDVQVIPDMQELTDRLCQDTRYDFPPIAKVLDYTIQAVRPESRFKQRCELTQVEEQVDPSNRTALGELSLGIARSWEQVFYFNRRVDPEVVGEFDNLLLTLYDFDKVSTFYWRRETNRNMLQEYKTSGYSAYALSIRSLLLVFYVLLIGIASSAVAFLLEIVIYRNTYRRPRSRSIV